MRVHILQYEVWKKSMFIRYLLEACIFTIIAGFFQTYISRFNRDVHKLGSDLSHIDAWLTVDGYESMNGYKADFRELVVDAGHASIDFQKAMYLSLICFSFPVRTLMIIVFAKRSGRNYKILNLNTVLDMALFGGVLTWFFRYNYLQATNHNRHYEGLSDSDIYVMRIVEQI